MRMLLNGLLAAIVGLAAINGAAAQSPQNEAIAQGIAQQLKESGRLQGYKIGIKYQEGRAWLLGEVSSQQQMQAAIDVARGNPQVREVVNKLNVKPANTAQPAAPSNVQLTSGPQLDVTPTQLQLPPANAPQAAAAARPMPQPAGPAIRTAGLHGHGRGMRRGGAAMAGPGVAAGPGYPGAAGGYMPQGSMQPVSYDSPAMPGYAWPSYAAHPNYAALTYPKQYSPSAWPYIGPFYPYPQVPLGWRKVTLEWDDGWWFLDFNE